MTLRCCPKIINRISSVISVLRPIRSRSTRFRKPNDGYDDKNTFSFRPLDLMFPDYYFRTSRISIYYLCRNDEQFQLTILLQSICSSVVICLFGKCQKSQKRHRFCVKDIKEYLKCLYQSLRASARFRSVVFMLMRATTSTTAIRVRFSSKTYDGRRDFCFLHNAYSSLCPFKRVVSYRFFLFLFFFVCLTQLIVYNICTYCRVRTRKVNNVRLFVQTISCNV